MSNTKKRPDFSEKPVESVNSGSKKLTASLNENCSEVRALMNNSSDLIIKYFAADNHKMAVITCEGMIGKADLANLIFRPLVASPPKIQDDNDFFCTVCSDMPIAEEQKQVYDFDTLCLNIMSGFAVLLCDGAGFGIAIGIQGYSHRSIDEPSTHINLRASREGFIEVVRTNVAMVRRRMKSPTLKTVMMTIGDRSNTDVSVCYLTDKADVNTVNAVIDKLKNIPLNTIVSSEYLQSFLEPGGTTLFSQIFTTERPDVFVSKLYEGRVGIIVDGTPFALVLPCLFAENFVTMDDYTHKPYFSAFLRIIRFFAFIAGAILPGLYVALCNFHPEMFRSALLLNIYSSVQTTAYPVFGECLIMYLLYEIMREAGLRLPRSVGHAVSIVGGLVIGEISVSAGLMSAPVVLIIAATGLCSFAVPDLYDSCMILRLVFIVAGGMLGLFGITVVGVVVFFRICSKNAYGVPYTAPFAPITFKSIVRDTFYRAGWRKLSGSDMTVQQLSGKAKSRYGSERTMRDEQDK